MLLEKQLDKEQIQKCGIKMATIKPLARDELHHFKGYDDPLDFFREQINVALREAYSNGKETASVLVSRWNLSERESKILRRDYAEYDATIEREGPPHDEGELEIRLTIPDSLRDIVELPIKRNLLDRVLPVDNSLLQRIEEFERQNTSPALALAILEINSGLTEAYKRKEKEFFYTASDHSEPYLKEQEFNQILEMYRGFSPQLESQQQPDDRMTTIRFNLNNESKKKNYNSKNRKIKNEKK